MDKLNGVLMCIWQMCDIEMMFHQFHVPETDRNYLHFLWWKKGDITPQPQVFRMKVHLFGAALSTGGANYGLKHLAKEPSSRLTIHHERLLCR